MPLHTIGSDGAIASGNNENITIPANATTDILIYNYYGSAVSVLSSAPGTISSETLTRSSGVQEDVSGRVFTLGPDETVHLSVTNGATGTSWRLLSGKTTHGLGNKPGVGHGGSFDNLTGGIYTATI